jgi:hypothetical protein
MHNLYKKLNTESDHIKLTPDEKSAMRAAIFGAPKAAPSPFIFFASHRFLTALAALVLVVLAGGSTAVYAAQGALPGQPLYALKTKVLEPVEVALAPTSAAKARVETQIATRRVAEAQTLAAQGKLDATTTQELAASFNEYASQALALAGEDGAAATSSATTTEVASSTEENHAAEASSTATSTPQDEAQTESEDIHASIDEQRSLLNQIIEVQVGGHATTTSHKKRGK